MTLLEEDVDDMGQEVERLGCLGKSMKEMG